MTDRPGTWLKTAQPQLLALAAGFLRNTRRISGVNCPMCTGMPGQGWTECRDCRGMMIRNDLSDRLAFVTYGIKGQQSGHTMHGYKSPHAGPTQRQIVQLLAGVTLHRHNSCFTSPTHGRPTHWTTVPSLSGRAGDHPLVEVMAPILANLTRQALTPAIAVQSPRAVRPDNFTTPALAGEHILLIDDTWTTGGHVQSAAGALKRAGAGHVTTLVLARWIDPAWDNTAAVIREHLTADFNPAICPLHGHPLWKLSRAEPSGVRTVTGLEAPSAHKRLRGGQEATLVTPSPPAYEDLARRRPIGRIVQSSPQQAVQTWLHLDNCAPGTGM